MTTGRMGRVEHPGYPTGILTVRRHGAKTPSTFGTGLGGPNRGPRPNGTQTRVPGSGGRKDRVRQRVTASLAGVPRVLADETRYCKTSVSFAVGVLPQVSSPGS